MERKRERERLRERERDREGERERLANSTILFYKASMFKGSDRWLAGQMITIFCFIIRSFVE